MPSSSGFPSGRSSLSHRRTDNQECPPNSWGLAWWLPQNVSCWVHKCFRIKYYLQPNPGMYWWITHASSDYGVFEWGHSVEVRMECVAEAATREALHCQMVTPGWYEDWAGAIRWGMDHRKGRGIEVTGKRCWNSKWLWSIELTGKITLCQNLRPHLQKCVPNPCCTCDLFHCLSGNTSQSQQWCEVLRTQGVWLHGCISGSTSSLDPSHWTGTRATEGTTSLLPMHAPGACGCLYFFLKKKIFRDLFYS